MLTTLTTLSVSHYTINISWLFTVFILYCYSVLLVMSLLLHPPPPPPHTQAPNEFCDALIGSLMNEPVELPSSKAVMDRVVILRHLMRYVRMYMQDAHCYTHARVIAGTHALDIPCFSL